jgi:hypothetical protein
MPNRSDLLSGVNKVLDESKWDNLSMDLETGEIIEFANFESGEILYNIGNVDEKEYIKMLEQHFEFEIVVGESDNIIFKRDDNEDTERYLHEIQKILQNLDSSLDGISNMELKNII